MLEESYQWSPLLPQNDEFLSILLFVLEDISFLTELNTSFSWEKARLTMIIFAKEYKIIIQLR